MEKNIDYDVAIIGAGPAGMSTALYCARAGKKVLLVERAQVGGALNDTDKIDNYIGTGLVEGYELAESMFNQLPTDKVTTVLGKVTDIETNSVTVKSQGTETIYYISNLVIATGVSHKKLEIPGEELTRIPLSYCAVCDGMYYEGENVAIIGGGDAAFEEALYLSNIAKSVKIILRSDESRAKWYLQDQVSKKGNIEIFYNEPIKSITKIKNRNVLSINHKKTLQVDGIFVSIGIEPNNELLKILEKKELRRLVDKNGYALVDESDLTSKPLLNVYIAGDLRQPDNKQLVLAVGDAVKISKAISYN